MKNMICQGRNRRILTIFCIYIIVCMYSMCISLYLYYYCTIFYDIYYVLLLCFVNLYGHNIMFCTPSLIITILQCIQPNVPQMYNV